MIINHYQTCGECEFTPLCLPQIDQKMSHFNQCLPIQRQLVLKKGEILFTPHTPFQCLYAVKLGAIKTVQTESNGEELIRNFYFTGEIFGYKAIHQGEYRSTAKALCESHVCEINYREFLHFIQQNPHLQEHVMYSACSHINRGSYLHTKSAERKVAAFLLDLSNRLHPFPIKGVLYLPIPRQDIASYLRLTPETLSRISTKFIRNKIIAVDKRKLTLLKPELLQGIADGRVESKIEFR